jgi:hypothetical protein
MDLSLIDADAALVSDPVRLSFASVLFAVTNIVFGNHLVDFQRFVIFRFRANFPTCDRHFTCSDLLSSLQLSTKAHYRRGRALLALGRVDEAIAALQRVIELEPAHPDAAIIIGRARQQRQQQQSSA